MESNIDEFVQSQDKNQFKQDLWAILKLIDGTRLSDFIKSNSVDVHEAMRITRKILLAVKKIHNRNIVHRNIQPDNILVQHRLNSSEMDFMVIDFTSAWIINHQMNHSIEDIRDRLGNAFYRMPQFEPRPDQTEQIKDYQQSSTIDAAGVCAILFWLITHRPPREFKDIWGNTPHRMHENCKIIQKKIEEVTG